MSNRAWMPLHIDNYLADTGHLTATEHGAYMLLIFAFWQDGDLPKDEKVLARLARLSAAEWETSGMIILDLLARRGVKRVLTKATTEFRPALPAELKRLVRERDGERCRYCGCTEGPFDIDHDMPWSRGGKHELSNLLIACASCNRSKGALTASEFMGFDIEGHSL